MTCHISSLESGTLLRAPEVAVAASAGMARVRVMAKAMRRGAAGVLAALLSLVTVSVPATAQTILADQPIFAAVNVPGNVALVLSVEYPTGNSASNLGDYSDASTYLGYFDPAKCYTYVYNSPTYGSYFQPASFATGTNHHQCTAHWSGNFMNWAATQTIDPFRSALTGGYRSVDDTSTTILEKAWASYQGCSLGTAACNVSPP